MRSGDDEAKYGNGDDDDRGDKDAVDHEDDDGANDGGE